MTTTPPTAALDDPLTRAEAAIEHHIDRLTTRRKPVRLNVEAAAVARHLHDHDPEAWTAFVEATTSEVIMTRLRSGLGRRRTAAVRATKVKQHRAAITLLHGDTTRAVQQGQAPPSPLDARYAIGGGNWRRLGQMTRPDLLTVARHRRSLATTNLWEALFLEAVAERLPDDTTPVEESLTADDLIALHDKATPTPNPDTEQEQP